MLLNISAEELDPVIEAVVARTLAKIRDEESKLGDKLAFSEQEAASLIGLASHQLRDERRRGRIASASIVGRKIRYTRADIMAYLAKNRVEVHA